MAAKPDPHKAMGARLAKLRARYEQTVAALAAIEEERAEAYVEARRLDPPMTFREIAQAFGVTEAAVQQKINRHKTKEKAA